MKEKNKCSDDLALRRVIDEQAQRAKGMKLSEGFADRLMQEINDLPESEPMGLRPKVSVPIVRKIAAAIAVAVVISGIAYAACHVIFSSGDAPVGTATTACADVAVEADSVVSFEGLSLDSILGVVSAHYNRSVCVRGVAADSLRLTTVWDCGQPLSVFIETLNEFDGLRLTDRQDTIFVESVKVED